MITSYKTIFYCRKRKAKCSNALIHSLEIINIDRKETEEYDRK